MERPAKLDMVLSCFAGVKPSSKREMTWTALCPAHEDRKRSLSIWVGSKTGKVVVRCWAGCDFQKILLSVGLKTRDLLHDAVDFSQAPRRIVNTYDYTDECGRLLYQTVKYSPKAFAYRQPNCKGWIWNLEGARRVLYRLPELIDARKAGRTLWICEGEKDADSLWAIGLPATTNPCGASHWPVAWGSFFVDCPVVIAKDVGDAGTMHAIQVAGSCLLGGAASARIVSFDGLCASVKDVTDWLNIYFRDRSPLAKRMALLSWANTFQEFKNERSNQGSHRRDRQLGQGGWASGEEGAGADLPGPRPERQAQDAAEQVHGDAED